MIVEKISNPGISLRNSEIGRIQIGFKTKACRMIFGNHVVDGEIITFAPQANIGIGIMCSIPTPVKIDITFPVPSIDS